MKRFAADLGDGYAVALTVPERKPKNLFGFRPRIEWFVKGELAADFSNDDFAGCDWRAYRKWLVGVHQTLADEWQITMVCCVHHRGGKVEAWRHMPGKRPVKLTTVKGM